MTAPALFDPGLQPERTQLAWRRTAISVAVGSIVALRVLPSVFADPAWFGAGVAGFVFAGWIWWTAARRRAAFDGQRSRGVAEPLSSGGGALLIMALAASALGCAALAAVVMAGIA